MTPEPLTTLVTIDNDRYGGAYSGARYTAWNGFAPEDIDAGDGTCEHFWTSNSRICGKGDSPKEAFVDLRRQLCGKKYIFRPMFVDEAGTPHLFDTWAVAKGIDLE